MSGAICSICGKAAHEKPHLFSVASYKGEPFAATINLGDNNGDRHEPYVAALAAKLAKAVAEIRAIFPDKKLEILPGRSKGYEQRIHGSSDRDHVYVLEYIVIEG